jgi:hypothetical protein
MNNKQILIILNSYKLNEEESISLLKELLEAEK